MTAPLAHALGDKELVRVVVVGSVDDGKSSLIGRLLYECGGLFEDQIASIRKRSKDGVLDFSLFTDGLLAEREQGITIDVAYRYFSTPRRKVIIADTPGHVQYTRNMATGASTADAAVVLVDARLGVLAQTRRHAFIAHLLGIRSLAIAINKIDLVDDAVAVYARVRADVEAFTSQLGFAAVEAFAVSAVRGDNIATPSAFPALRGGRTLLEWLEAVPVQPDVDRAAFRFPVQTVLRPNLDYRGYAGTVTSGRVSVGDDVVVLPVGLRTKIVGIDTFEGSIPVARAPAAVVLRLADNVDVARGDLIAHPSQAPKPAERFDVDVVWFADKPVAPGQRFLLKHTTRRVQVHVDELLWKRDLETLAELPSTTLVLNDIGRLRITCSKPLVADVYAGDRSTGAFILIDALSNDTVGAGMIAAIIEDGAAPSLVKPVSAPATSTPLRERGLNESDLEGLLRALGSEDAVLAALTPLSVDKSALLQQLVHGLGLHELSWLSGYAAGLAQTQTQTQTQTPMLTPMLTPMPTQAQAPTATPSAATKPVTILYGTQTGNSRGLAEQLKARLLEIGVNARAVRTSSYATRELKDEAVVILVISTQGDGDPPDDSRGFWDFALSKKAPALAHTRFAVLALGDTSYPKFCHVGRVLDERFAALGATRITARADCDLDFEGTARDFCERVIEQLRGSGGAVVAQALVASPNVATAFSKTHPLSAPVLTNQRLTGRGSSKDVRHIELSLEVSGLHYEPGDALGVYAENPPFLVDELLTLLKASTDTAVTREGKTLPLGKWLSTELEITKLSRGFVDHHVKRGGEAVIDIKNRQIVDLLRQKPEGWDASAFVAALRKLTPRLYSIASSRARVGEEVHLLVAHVDFLVDGRRRAGAASHFLSTRTDAHRVDVFVEENDRFRLPADDADMIMIGPGTGVAPFRAFVQEREERGARGRNWLFFGEQHFSTSFYYQLEWQQAVAKGSLHRLDLAFSRDQRERIYVQQRLRERGAELWQWLEGGAYIYVCGDAERMAVDVEKALLDVAKRHGAHTDEQSSEWLSALRESGRYRRDVY